VPIRKLPAKHGVAQDFPRRLTGELQNYIADFPAGPCPDSTLVHHPLVTF
jgi:hypothetical protein